ncbi:hypothetical protein [Nocardia sp. NPDC052566]|uniref:hypothetical protein n=1 Tax=Nocardia sp. NPDC052566 TaxID=3364330 RepID=UPI0037CA2679
MTSSIAVPVTVTVAVRDVDSTAHRQHLEAVVAAMKIAVAGQLSALAVVVQGDNDHGEAFKRGDAIVIGPDYRRAVHNLEKAVARVDLLLPIADAMLPADAVEALLGGGDVALGAE